jgi:hypothetical protein
LRVLCFLACMKTRFVKKTVWYCNLTLCP